MKIDNKTYNSVLDYSKSEIKIVKSVVLKILSNKFLIHLLLLTKDEILIDPKCKYTGNILMCIRDIITKRKTFIEDFDFSIIELGTYKIKSKECSALLKDCSLNVLEIPKDTILYKGMPPGKLKNYFRGKKYPFPTYYSTKQIADTYATRYLSPSVKFKTIRNVRVLVTSDIENIKMLYNILMKLPINKYKSISDGKKLLHSDDDIKILIDKISKVLPNEYENVVDLYNTEHKNKKYSFVDDFKQAYGYNISGKDQREYHNKMFNDRYYNILVRDNKDIPNDQIKRYSITELDISISNKLCMLFNELFPDEKIDGIIASRLTNSCDVAGFMSGEFHEELMLCYAPEVLTQIT